MSDPRFLAMRTGLVARGLLSADLALTPAGHEFVDQLIGKLKPAEAPCDPDRERVRWNWPRRRAA